MNCMQKDSLGIASFRQMEASLQISEEYNVRYLIVNLQSRMCSLGHADVPRWLSGLAIKSRGRILGRISASLSISRNKISDRNSRPVANVKQQQRICPCRDEEGRQPAKPEAQMAAGPTGPCAKVLKLARARASLDPPMQIHFLQISEYLY